MRCPLCGLKFAPTDAKSLCSKCPLSRNCGLSCCPHCGYQIPREPRWLRSLRCWLQSYRLTAPSTNEMLLTALPLGQTAEIVQICSPDKTTGRKLLALGLLPGSRVRLLRRFPCYLLELGQAQLALDREIALAIRVHRDQEIETRSAVRDALAPPDAIAVPQQQSRPH